MARPGSTDHPARGSVFFDGGVRRPDCSLYSATKRLQEELCRQFYDADGLRTVVLRPDGIDDLRHGQPPTLFIAIITPPCICN